MRQKIICVGMIIGQALIFCPGNAATDYLAAAKKKYPYVLIGEDFGVLTADDLAANTCEVESGPLSEDNLASIYWQCFETRDVHFKCELSDDEEVPIAHLQGWPQIDIFAKTGYQNYMTRRTFPIADCRDLEKTFLKLTKGTKHICIAGSLIWYQKVQEDGVKETAWLFEKYRTPKGCDSNFADVCSLKMMIKHKHCELFRGH